MLRMIAVSYWPDRRPALPDHWEIWETTTPIPETYAQIASTAVEEGWDRDTVVIQDDVRLISTPESDADLVVYGQSGPDDHVCPRAFAATPHVWEHLARQWQPWNGQICLTWAPVVARYGEVLDVTTHG